MNGEDLLGLARDALAHAGEAEAEIAIRHRTRGFARFARGELGQHMELEEPLAAIRVAHGARVAEVQTSRLERADLVEAVREAAAAARVVPETDGFPGFAGAGGPCLAPPRFAESTATMDAEGRAALLRPALARVEAAGLLAAGTLETSRRALAVATTRGCARSHDGTLASYKVWALETPGAGGATGYGGRMQRDVQALDLDAETMHAVERAKLQRDPVALAAGTYDVVLEPAALAELLEWLAAITFGAPELEQGTSAFHGKLGARVTGEAITLVEDPNQAGDLGFAAPFDREGTARRAVPLVDRGMAVEALFDRTYGARAGVESTGSALAPEGGGGGIGCSALTMAGGDVEDVESLLRGMRRGLYVCRLHYVNGFLEPRRAVMTGLTRDGCFLVENGTIARPVGNMRFTDSLLEALARCDGITRARRAIPTSWSEAGAIVAPAVRLRDFRFNGGSALPPRG